MVSPWASGNQRKPLAARNVFSVPFIHFKRLPAIIVALAARLGRHQHSGGCGWGNERSTAEVPRAARKQRNSYSPTCPRALLTHLAQRDSIASVCISGPFSVCLESQLASEREWLQLGKLRYLHKTNSFLPTVICWLHGACVELILSNILICLPTSNG